MSFNNAVVTIQVLLPQPLQTGKLCIIETGVPPLSSLSGIQGKKLFPAKSIGILL